MMTKRIILLLLCFAVCQLGYTQVVPSIDRTPEPEKKTYSLSVSNNSLSFPASGGSQTITVTSSQSWQIDVPTASWGHLSWNGSQITVKIDANSDTSSRTDYFTIKSGDKTQRVDISQAAKEKEYSLSVSNSSLSFPASGGSQTITVTSSQSWQIDVSTNSWGHLSKNGSQLTIKIDPNNNTSSRTDYFTIKSGDKTQRVDISQAAKEKEYSLSVSKSSLSFFAKGGTETITVSSSQPWEIDVSTNSWGHLSKNGSQLTIKIDPNNTTSTRTDYFTIKSGNITRRVNISQTGRTATSTTTTSTYISPISPYYNYYDTGSVVQFGIGITDFAWNCFSTGNGNICHYDIALSVKFGHYRSPVQFEVGVMPGMLMDLDDYSKDRWDPDISVKFRMPIYARLKINLCNVGDECKLYVSGMAYYNVLRDKNYENRFSAGGGAGFAWKHWDLQVIYYKQDISHDCWRRDRFIGTGISYYL